MTCGCKNIVVPEVTRRARAAMCLTCLDADRGFGMDAIHCTVSGKTIETHVLQSDLTCPEGKHPDSDGCITWGGVRWYGVPMPVRWLLRRKLTGPLSGCGCIKLLKDCWVWVVGLFQEKQYGYK